jgi:hypothetical protein
VRGRPWGAWLAASASHRCPLKALAGRRIIPSGPLHPTRALAGWPIVFSRKSASVAVRRPSRFGCSRLALWFCNRSRSLAPGSQPTGLFARPAPRGVPAPASDIREVPIAGDNRQTPCRAWECFGGVQSGVISWDCVLGGGGRRQGAWRWAGLGLWGHAPRLGTAWRLVCRGWGRRGLCAMAGDGMALCLRGLFDGVAAPRPGTAWCFVYGIFAMGLCAGLEGRVMAGARRLGGFWL